MYFTNWFKEVARSKPLTSGTLFRENNEAFATVASMYDENKRCESP
jgi:hypothetical protein